MTKRSNVRALLMLALGAAAVGMWSSGCGKTPPPTPIGPEEAWTPTTDNTPSPKVLLALSRLLASQGKDAEAQFVLEKVLREEPKFIPAYVDLAELHMRHDRTELARQTLRCVCSGRTIVSSRTTWA